MTESFFGFVAPPFDTVETDVHPIAVEEVESSTSDPVALDVVPRGYAPVNDNPAEQYPRPHPTPAQVPNPVPVIGTMNLGGIVQDAGALNNPAGVVPKTYAIGTSRAARPDTLGIVIYAGAGAGTCDIVPDGQPDTLAPGFRLPAGGVATMPIYLPLKRCQVQITGALIVYYIIIAAGLSNG